MSRLIPTILLYPSLLFAMEARLPRHPAPSPTGSTLVFSWQGDLWEVRASGGVARRLTANPADDRFPVWSRDGRLIAFASDRHGSLDVFVMPADLSSAPLRLTHDASDDVPVDFTPEGTGVLFSSQRAESTRRTPALYRVPVDGGTPALEQAALGFEAAFSPNGSRLAFVRGFSPWWRHGYRGSGKREIWLRTPDGAMTRVSQHDGDEDRPGWIDEHHLLLRSERQPRKNLYVVELRDGSTRALTAHDGDVRFPRVSADGRVVAYELEDSIYVVPTAGGTPVRVRIEVAADEIEPAIERHLDRADAVELAVHPSDDVVATIVHGEVFLSGVRDKDEQAMAAAPTVAVTQSAARERDVAFAPDGQSLLFASDREGSHDLYLARPSAGAGWISGLNFDLTRLTREVADERQARFSPDGKRIAFVRGNGDLVRIDADGANPTTLLRHWSALEFDWSPDSKWLAYATEDVEHNSDVWLLSAEGGEPYNVSRHPDADGEPRFSPDGRQLLWVSRRHGDEFDVWGVWLAREDHERLAEGWLSLFKGEAKSKGGEGAKEGEKKRDEDQDKDAAEEEPTPRATTIDFDRLWERARVIDSLEGDESAPFATPDGKRILFSAAPDGERDLYSVRFDGKDRKRLTSGGKSPRGAAVSHDGKTVYFVTGKGVVERVDFEGKPGDPVPVEARHEIDRAAVRAAAFLEAWRELEAHFYDPAFHGVDWTAVRELYRPWAMTASTEEDFADVMRLMLGELDSSHLNYTPAPDAKPIAASGVLGAMFDPAAGGPGLRVREVLEDSPAARLDVALRRGERILAVDARDLLPNIDIASLLLDKVGQRVGLTIAAIDGTRRDVVVVPISLADERQLRYRAWSRERRALVDRWSSGRLGYLHIQGMNEPSFEVFERDLYAAAHGKEGLIIDVRSNGGGWTTDYLMAVLNVVRHARTVARGADPSVRAYPQSRLRLAAWTRPALALCNEESFSNAEIFSHAFKSLGRGRVVGTPTFGGVISTGDITLVNGARFRLPFRGWFVTGSELNMERNGFVPDVVVPQPPEQDTQADHDAQLERAVMVMLDELKTDPRRGAW